MQALAHGHIVLSRNGVFAGSSVTITRRIVLHQPSLSLHHKRNCKAQLCVFASSQPEVTTKKWILEPTGDGDCTHLGMAVPLPSAFELTVDSATVGRVEGKADIVIPVGTVSGLHARLEKKGTMLLVTDLDSTNGTYVGNRRLRPGAVTPVAEGSSITFGDEHLAQFKFSIIEDSID